MKPISRRQFVLGAGTGLTGLLAADGLWLEHFFIEFNEFFIGSSTTETNNIKLLQISDLHLKRMSPRHSNLISRINEIKPNMILFTGDIVDSNKNLHLLDEFLGKLDSSIQKTAILGNWECWEVNPLKLLEVYEKHDCELIVNHSYQYSFGQTTLAISGMDDYLGGKADFKMAMEFYTPSTYHVVMTHCPEHYDVILKQMENVSIDLVLSGHTHGGQLNIFGYAPIRPPRSGRYVAGWYRESFPPLYVSRGIGTSALPIRLGSRAEVSIFNFQS